MVNNCAIAKRNGYLIEGTFDSSMKIRFVLFGKSDKESKIKKLSHHTLPRHISNSSQ